MDERMNKENVMFWQFVGLYLNDELINKMCLKKMWNIEEPGAIADFLGLWLWASYLSPLCLVSGTITGSIS